MSPILNVKCMKWTLNRIHYYYKTLHTNLHYFNVSVGQCDNAHDSPVFPLSRVSPPLVPLFGLPVPILFKLISPQPCVINYLL